MTEFKGYRAGKPRINQIAARLNDRIDDVIAFLHLHGSRDGNDYVCKNPTRSDKEAGSFRICIKPPSPIDGGRCGLWLDHATGDKGDAFDLLKYVGGYDTDAAKEVACSILGWNGDTITDLPQVKERPKHEAVEEKKQAAKENKWAQSLFLKGVEKIAETPVDFYLRNRGIDLSVLGRQPHAIRFYPECPVDFKTNPADRRRLPAMIANRQTASGVCVGVHITYLGQYDGIWKKSVDIKPVKKMIGQCPGSFVPICRGSSGKPLKEAPEGSSVLIAEGIETALSLAVALPEERILAALSVTNIKNIDLPPAVKNVYLCVDVDEGGSTAAAYNKAAETFKEQGRSVFRVCPANGYNDFNDMLTGGLAPFAGLDTGRGGEDAPF